MSSETRLKPVLPKAHFLSSLQNLSLKFHSYWNNNEYVEQTGDTTKTIIASTASPFKFCDNVLHALGVEELRQGTATANGRSLDVKKFGSDLHKNLHLPAREARKALCFNTLFYYSGKRVVCQWIIG